MVLILSGQIHYVPDLIPTGVFKAPEQVDIFVDLKKIPQLYSTTVSIALCAWPVRVNTAR